MWSFIIDEAFLSTDCWQQEEHLPCKHSALTVPVVPICEIFGNMT